MTQKTKAWTVTALALAAAAGIAAGMILFSGQNAQSQYGSIREIKSLDDAKDLLISSASALMTEAFIVFISGFTMFPLLISIPVVAYRGLALGCAVSSAVPELSYFIIPIITYTASTFLISLLAYFAREFSSHPQKKTVKEITSFSYSFFAIGGAAILIKIVPVVISDMIR